MNTGLLGSAMAGGGLYTFAPSVTLAGGSTYYFYENTLLGPSALLGNAQYSGGGIFTASGPASLFSFDPATSADFLVTNAGGTSATPEPSSFLLLGTGLMGLAGAIKRRLA